MLKGNLYSTQCQYNYRLVTSLNSLIFKINDPTYPDSSMCVTAITGLSNNTDILKLVFTPIISSTWYISGDLDYTNSPNVWYINPNAPVSQQIDKIKLYGLESCRLDFYDLGNIPQNISISFSSTTKLDFDLI